MRDRDGDCDLPLARPAPNAPVATLWVVLTALFHGEPATRAENPGFARGSKPVAEVYTAARAVEWLIRSVSRLYLEGNPDQPEWLEHVNAGTMKVKLSMSLIGISSIHLLKTFIEAPNLTQQTMMWQVIIHLTFVLSALAMAFTNRLMETKAH